MAKTKQKLLVVQDGTILALANNPTFTKEFPFLVAIGRAAKAKGCGSCGGRSRYRAEALKLAKKRIAGLSSDRKQRLKKMLDAERIRIIYRDAGGKLVKLTF